MSEDKASNADLVRQLKAVECPDSTYGGFQPPLVLQEGSGSIVRDCEGRDYIDLCAGFGSLVLGHNHPAIAQVFAKQQGSSRKDGFAPVLQGMGDVYASEAKVALLSRLAKALPQHLNVGALSVTGSQAVEFALRTAYLVNRRPKVLCFVGCYHGTDLGVLPYTHGAKFKQQFKGLLEDRAVFVPYGAKAKEVEDQLARQGVSPADISAMVVEPIQGRAGTHLPPQGWLQEMADLVRGWGSLVIFDEVFTGMGRAGRLCQAELSPCDIICIGKGLGGGMPLSACFSSAKIMAAWPESTGEAQHTGTFFGHPLSCAVANAVVATLIDENLCHRSLQLGEHVTALLSEQLPQYDCRGVGLMQVVAGAPGFGVEAMTQLRTKGVHALVSGAQGECLAITPALTIDRSLLTQALDHVVAVAKNLPLSFRPS